VTEILLFGPFRLAPARRELTAHGVPLTIGQRAFDVLLTLVNRSGQLTTKDEIMAAVWPGIIVDDNTLQVHVSALRKVLGSTGEGDKYLVTVAGRGYRFVAPVTREAEARQEPATKPTDAFAAPFPAPANHNLPQQPTRLIGRETELADIQTELTRHRLVTLTGAGGVGKTRLAIEAGANLAQSYRDGVWLIELAALNEQLVTSVLAERFQEPARTARA
jgi:DNA-binding winged helix-turn-helix (wHTH) protein